MSRSDLPGTIMRERRSGLVSYAGKMLGDHGLAEDIVQETHTIQATADILGIPVGTVKSRHRNALRKLRSAVRPEAA
ncbi:sigma factor-like helix-turn-helix DNA-binding protein [Streptomyces sp. NPDC005485]|uniref:sigma factor-like helix-turn-helix DNA-binding protein n=1 Tax=Streptomyces sp. NPDC005485 TaxID=3155591 RepID=UPI00339F0FD7